MESDEQIKSVENCSIVSGDDSAHQWSRDNQGKPPSEKTAALKEALQEAQYCMTILMKSRKERMKEKEEIQYHGVLEHK